MKNLSSTLAIAVVSAMFAINASAQAEPLNSSDVKPSSEDQQEVFKTLEDRFSYAWGADLAKKFKSQGLILNVELMAAGMQDVFSDGEKLMSFDEIATTLDVYKQVHAKKLEAKRAADGEKNLKEGATFLAENAKKEGIVVTDSGLQYKVIRAGEGGYKPSLEDEIVVHYRARFVDGTEFDNTYARDEPFSVKAGQLIEGWAEALQLMTKGARWELYIPAEIAYGERGSGEFVGPNATLIFDVELLDVKQVSDKSS